MGYRLSLLGGSKVAALACLLMFCGFAARGAEEGGQSQPSAQPQAAEQQRQAEPQRPRPYTGDGVPSIGLFYWLSPAKPKMRTGADIPQGARADLDFARKEFQSTPGVVLSLPGGGQHTIRMSYFRTRGQGNTFAANDTTIFGTGFAPGDYLNTNYTLQNGKLSFEYLSWPFPVNFSGLRVKTFWEVQYTGIKYAIDAPLRATQDEDGNYINNFAEGSHWFLYPAFGVGVEKMISRGFRVEAKASGFALPDRPRLVDAEAFAAYRAGQYEIQFGAKAFHFRTSPREEQFVTGTLSGAYVGMRWYPKW